ncbi:hypothetical protein PM082_019578 [Marasmius tenuissimus]|nr:hypothetical protein PM082_019578 [Marasmius tenuissimus]
MFLISSFKFWANVYLLLQGVLDVLVNDPEKDPTEKQAHYRGSLHRFASVDQMMLSLQIIVGDSIVLWRAWALCVFNRKPVYISMVFLLGTMRYMGCTVHIDWSTATTHPTCDALQISAYSLSFVTNVSGTLAIGYTVWYVLATFITSYVYLRTASVRSARLSRLEVGLLLNQWPLLRTQAGKILILLIKSGIAYSILWVIRLSSEIPATY